MKKIIFLLCAFIGTYSITAMEKESITNPFNENTFNEAQYKEIKEKFNKNPNLFEITYNKNNTFKPFEVVVITRTSGEKQVGQIIHDYGNNKYKVTFGHSSLMYDDGQAKTSSAEAIGKINLFSAQKPQESAKQKPQESVNLQRVRLGSKTFKDELKREYQSNPNFFEISFNKNNRFMELEPVFIKLSNGQMIITEALQGINHPSAVRTEVADPEAVNGSRFIEFEKIGKIDNLFLINSLIIGKIIREY